MAQLNFPDPQVTTTYTEAGITWTWNNTLGVWSTEGISAAGTYTAPGGVSRTVESRLTDYISVKDFGAVGDGNTDDTAAIQAAFDSLTFYDTLFFPDGSYKLTSTIDAGITGITVIANGAQFDSYHKGVMFDLNPDFDENNVEATSKSYIEWRGGVFRYNGATPEDINGVIALSVRGI